MPGSGVFKREKLTPKGGPSYTRAKQRLGWDEFVQQRKMVALHPFPNAKSTKTTNTVEKHATAEGLIAEAAQTALAAEQRMLPYFEKLVGRPGHSVFMIGGLAVAFAQAPHTDLAPGMAGKVAIVPFVDGYSMLVAPWPSWRAVTASGSDATALMMRWLKGATSMENPLAKGTMATFPAIPGARSA